MASTLRNIVEEKIAAFRDHVAECEGCREALAKGTIESVGPIALALLRAAAEPEAKPHCPPGTMCAVCEPCPNGHGGQHCMASSGGKTECINCGRLG